MMPDEKRFGEETVLKENQLQHEDGQNPPLAGVEPTNVLGTLPGESWRRRNIMPRDFRWHQGCSIRNWKVGSESHNWECPRRLVGITDSGISEEAWGLSGQRQINSRAVND